jgi:HAD superfamily hydrolase (TIGR01549 family)
MQTLVIFDFDGPLFDGRSARNRALRLVHEEVCEEFGAFEIEIDQLPLLTPDATLITTYARRQEILKKLDHFDQRFREAIKAEELTQPFIEGTLATIDELRKKGCKVAILSLRPQAELKDLLRTRRALRHFDHVSGRDTPPAAKPARESVLEICKLTDARPEHAIFVGDTDIDLNTARAAGVEYFHAGWSKEPSSRSVHDCDLVLQRPGELAILVAGSQASPKEIFDTQIAARAILEGPFSFFAGAGVSVSSGVGDWKNAYKPMLESFFPERLMTGHSVPELLDLICAVDLAPEQLFDAFKKVFDDVTPQPSEYHFSMVRSACSTIWTTNYDTLFERARDNAREPMYTVTGNADMQDRFGADRLIVKVNGDFKSAKFDPSSRNWNIVLTEEQFDRSEVERPEIWRYFEDEYRSSSLVFVGVSFGDPMLKRILSIASRRVMRTRRKHFVLMKRPRTHGELLIFNRQSEVLRSRNLFVLWFNDYPDIADFVSQVCAMSRRPAVGFSGITHFAALDGREPSATELASSQLAGGKLSKSRIAELAAEMGRQLADRGYRVISGHGLGVGVPAVQAAHDVDAARAKYVIRKEGKTIVRRGVPVAYVAGGSDYSAARRKLIDSSAVMIAMGGNSADETGVEPIKSGTADEVLQAIKAQTPVLLFPQCGGDVHTCWETFLLRMNNGYRDAAVRDHTVELNQRIASLSPDALLDFAAGIEFTNAVDRLVTALIRSPSEDKFRASSLESKSLW